MVLRLPSLVGAPLSINALREDLQMAHQTVARWIALHYFRDVDRREVDFVVTENDRPLMLVECKHSDKSISNALRYLKARFAQATIYIIIR